MDYAICGDQTQTALRMTLTVRVAERSHIVRRNSESRRQPIQAEEADAEVEAA